MPDRPVPDITLYFSLASRSFTPRWLLEELAIPYRVETVNLRERAQKRPDYLRINPMGKVPALTDGEVVVTENPAICLYLADRYGYGRLAPTIEAPERGAYLRWMVFSTAVVEPAVYLHEPPDPDASSGRGWGDFDTVMNVLRHAVTPGPWLLGGAFSAADVMLGSILSIAFLNNRIPNDPVLKAYDERLAGRDAYKRAAAATWPPDVSGGT